MYTAQYLVMPVSLNWSVQPFTFDIVIDKFGINPTTILLAVFCLFLLSSFKNLCLTAFCLSCLSIFYDSFLICPISFLCITLNFLVDTLFYRLPSNNVMQLHMYWGHPKQCSPFPVFVLLFQFFYFLHMLKIHSLFLQFSLIK